MNAQNKQAYYTDQWMFIIMQNVKMNLNQGGCSRKSLKKLLRTLKDVWITFWTCILLFKIYIVINVDIQFIACIQDLLSDACEV